MNENESALVICAFILAIILYVIAMIKGPRLGIGITDVYFDKTQLPKFSIFLLLIMLASIPIGYAVTPRFDLVLGFAGLNGLIAAIMGLRIFLYKYKPSKNGK